MQTGKILRLFVGAVCASVGLVLLSVWLYVDPNAYKAELAGVVKEVTGRDLLLQGNIRLVLLPWVALRLGPARLGTPTGSLSQSVASFRNAEVRVRLLPLLRKQLEISRVQIDGLELRVEDSDGDGNWHDDLRKPLPAIKVTNARISYERYVIENLNFETASITAGVVPVALRFDANRGIANEHLTVDAKLDISHPDDRRYRIAALTMVGQVRRLQHDRPIRWNGSSAMLDVDLKQQTLTVPSLALTIAGAQLSGSLTGSTLLSSPDFNCALKLAPLVVREFVPRLGWVTPQTNDPRALSLVSGSAGLHYSADMLRIDPLQVVLDDSRLRGEFAADLRTQALQFNLSIDHIDLDRYRLPEGAPATAQPPTAVAKTLIDLHGMLAVESLRLANLEFTQAHVTLGAKAGLMTLFPLQAQIAGGRYSGDIEWDERGDNARLSLDEHLVAIDMSKLVMREGKNLHVSGRGNLDVKASGIGHNADAILQTLNGRMEAYVTAGAVEGVDIGYQLGRADALLRNATPAPPPDTHRTPFTAIQMSAQITDGVAAIHDLILSSPALRVTGQGSIALSNSSLDIQLLANTAKPLGANSVQLPVHVTGTLSDPSVRPEVEQLQDVLRDRLKGLFGKP